MHMAKKHLLISVVAVMFIFVGVYTRYGLLDSGVIILKDVFRNQMGMTGYTYKNVHTKHKGSCGHQENNQTGCRSEYPRIDSDTKVTKRFRERQSQLQSVCRQNLYLANNNRSIPSPVLDMAAGRVKWCMIPKVGTTFTKSFNRNYAENYYSNTTESETPVNVVFVREPYSRLVSGYLDKVLLFPSWYPWFGHTVMKFAGVLGRNSSWYDRCSVYATFPQFITYFIASEKTGTGRNNHFLPMRDQCQFCARKYSYIGHLETFQEDFDYILKNVSIKIRQRNRDTDEDSKNHFFSKIRRIIKIEKKYVSNCTDIFTALKTLWFTYHARGFIPDTFQFPLSKKQSDNITEDTFLDIVQNAYKQSKGKFNPRKQKREYLTELYLQVSLADRLMLKNILKPDFEMFDYDPQPPYIFPELSGS